MQDSATMEILDPEKYRRANGGGEERPLFCNRATPIRKCFRELFFLAGTMGGVTTGEIVQVNAFDSTEKTQISPVRRGPQVGLLRSFGSRSGSDILTFS